MIGGMNRSAALQKAALVPTCLVLCLDIYRLPAFLLQRSPVLLSVALCVTMVVAPILPFAFQRRFGRPSLSMIFAASLSVITALQWAITGAMYLIVENAMLQ